MNIKIFCRSSFFLPGRAKDLSVPLYIYIYIYIYIRGADKSLARPTSRFIFFVGENISFDASLVIYIYIYIQY